ncbi:MAG: DUF2306 domain-containing protein [Bacteroidota bacterium]
MSNQIRYRLQPAWWVMTVLAIAVAGYAFVFPFIDKMGDSGMREKFASMPLAAWGHMIWGGLALLIGPFQLNKSLRRNSIGRHRLLGRVYLICVLLSGIAALVLAFSANGGLAASLGFAGLGIGWLVTGALAFTTIRKGDVAAHRRWMIRNYALTLAAVTLRIYLPVAMVSGLPFVPAYIAISWLCWVPNVLVAEWYFIRRPDKRSVRRAVA